MTILIVMAMAMTMAMSMASPATACGDGDPVRRPTVSFVTILCYRFFNSSPAHEFFLFQTILMMILTMRLGTMVLAIDDQGE